MGRAEIRTKFFTNYFSLKRNVILISLTNHCFITAETFISMLFHFLELTFNENRIDSFIIDATSIEIFNIRKMRK